MIRKDIKLEKGPEYHNPDPLVRLIGDTNESNIKVDGVSCKGLVDSVAQISTTTKSFAKAFRLKNYHLDGLLDIEGTARMEVPYQVYVEVNLNIPEVRAYHQDVQMLFVHDSKFWDKVPKQIGTQVIDTTLQVFTKKELSNASNW